MLRLAFVALALASPAQLVVIETIFEHGIDVKDEQFPHSTRYLTVPAGTCNFTLYPSNLVCTVENPFPYWLQIKVVDLKMSYTAISEDMLEVSINRNELASAGAGGAGGGARAASGLCYTAARVFLAARCGPKVVTQFDKWEVGPIFPHI